METAYQQKTNFNEALSSLSLLQEGQPSVTALRVALRRAAHQVLDSPRVFEDLLAVPIVGRENALTLASPDKYGDFESRFIRAFMVSRSRYAEDQLARAVDRGCAQYVVLGAGLDTFAYRNPYSAQGLRVFEVDHPATQAWKRERLAAGQISIPASVEFVPVDFERQSLSDALAERGFDRRLPAFFSWLGVTPYLTATAFEATLEFVASMPPGSGVTFDYAVARSALSPMERCAFDILAKRVADVGEAFQLFFEPDEMGMQLRDQRFREVEQLGSAEINARYFSGRLDGLQVFGNFANLVNALV